MRFAQVEVDARVEQSSKHGVHYYSREVVGMCTRNADVSHAKLRLRRLRFGDDVHRAFGPRRPIDGLCFGWRHTRPTAEGADSQVRGDWGRDITHDHQRRGGRNEARLEKRLNVSARDGGDALLVASFGHAVPRGTFIQESRKQFVGEATRLRAQL